MKHFSTTLSWMKQTEAQIRQADASALKAIMQHLAPPGIWLTLKTFWPSPPGLANMLAVCLVLYTFVILQLKLWLAIFNFAGWPVSAFFTHILPFGSGFLVLLIAMGIAGVRGYIGVLKSALFMAAGIAMIATGFFTCTWGIFLYGGNIQVWELVASTSGAGFTVLSLWLLSARRFRTLAQVVLYHHAEFKQAQQASIPAKKLMQKTAQVKKISLKHFSTTLAWMKQTEAQIRQANTQELAALVGTHSLDSSSKHPDAPYNLALNAGFALLSYLLAHGMFWQWLCHLFNWPVHIQVVGMLALPALFIASLITLLSFCVRGYYQAMKGYLIQFGVTVVIVAGYVIFACLYSLAGQSDSAHSYLLTAVIALGGITFSYAMLNARRFRTVASMALYNRAMRKQTELGIQARHAKQLYSQRASVRRSSKGQKKTK
ncbi:hypothetical protein [Mangrovibacter yixingensis]|uniref:hypothetical protein n=1 Tax=Mangrovibacter yixingensis TaxID=1529639 RepID=UPI001CFD013E|nr:hypothetical protein [Mangrovibacter yixingensis]